jgi:hypothetical protein
MTRSLHYFAFFVGLAVLCWVGAGYIGTNPLALAITLLVGAFYLMGALELRRFHDATTTLARAADATPDVPANLGHWLDQLHPSLRNPVRLRIEGERVGLPGPALTPYLTGLLVLLGMLGTFLGMVVTLNGTGTALESASDLLAIRSSLAAPVKGLGLAFGTSLAGVAASAMLGLICALCRRDRLLAAQLLDTRIATTLRVFSLAHQREESFRLLQRQADAMPVLVDRLQAMMTAIEGQSQALNKRLIDGQEHFHSQAEAAYADLASSFGRSLTQSLGESARVAGATIQPVVEATMAAIAREAARLHDSVEHSVQRQLDGLSSRLEASTLAMAALWQSALGAHERTNQALSTDLRSSLDHFAETFEQRSASLVDGVGARLETAVNSVSDSWRSALAQHARASEDLSGNTRRALEVAAASFEQHSASLLHSLDKAHAQQQAEIASRDQQRLAAWTDALASMAASLQQTTRDIAVQTEAQAKTTIAEVAQLVQATSEAPRIAAEVIAELRKNLSDSMLRDNAMLEERSRIMKTLGTLLDAVNHACTEQRTAIDALVAASANALEHAGARFTEEVDAQTARMTEVAAQLTGSAVEVASLGEAFGVAVQLFSQSNDKLGAQLQRIEGALGRSIARSDEQLAYYVAQAREVIDLSMLSQKQIVEDLQQIASPRRALAGSEA